MTLPILTTRLYIPPPRPQAIQRPQLLVRLNEGLRPDQGIGRKLTLISAAAGCRKTTLLSQWVAICRQPVAWLSLDEGDSDPVRFLAYLIAALQTIAPGVGAGVLTALQASQPPSQEALLTALLNNVAAIPHAFILVLDDYHAIDAPPVDAALAFLLDHMPPGCTWLSPPAKIRRYLWRACAPATNSPNCAPPTCVLRRTKPPRFSTRRWA